MCLADINIPFFGFNPSTNFPKPLVPKKNFSLGCKYQVQISQPHHQTTQTKLHPQHP